MEAAQHDAEAVVGKFGGAEVLVQQGCQRVLVTQGPVLDGHLAVVGLGEDEGNPRGSQGAIGETLVEVVVAQMALQDVRQAELFDDAEEEGDVIHAFVL
jgi:hypothetical protein